MPRRRAGAAALLSAALLMAAAGPACARMSVDEARAALRAALGRPIAEAPVDHVAAAMSGLVEDLPPDRLQDAVDLVAGVSPLLSADDAAAVAEAARAAAVRVAERHPAAVEEWWARVIADSVAMAAAPGHGTAAPARPAGPPLSFGRARARVAARMGRPIAGAPTAALARAVGAEVSALAPQDMAHAITFAGAVAAVLADPAAVDAVAAAARRAVYTAAARYPAALPEWQRDDIVESITLFVGDRAGVSAGGPQGAPAPVHALPAGDLVLVPYRRDTAPRPDEGEVRPPPIAAALPPAALPDRLPTLDEARARLAADGLPATTLNLNRAMAALLSGRRAEGEGAVAASDGAEAVQDASLPDDERTDPMLPTDGFGS